MLINSNKKCWCNLKKHYLKWNGLVRSEEHQSKMSLASCRMEIKHEATGSKSRVYWRYRESRYKQEFLGDSEGKMSMSLGFVWGSGVFIEAAGWWVCPLRNSGTGQTRMRAQVSSTRHLHPGAGGSASRCSESVVLESVHEGPHLVTP